VVPVALPAIMKITVKHRLVIFHREHEWNQVYAQIRRDYGMRMALQSALCRELGFSVRRHRALVPNEVQYKHGPSMHYEQHVHLDFFNDAAQSLFLLKYVPDQENPQ